ncbi:Rdx family protein [Enhygromyxa salina]|uniref:Rdx family protein n=1 Tax=Enhygromyxa salina TaxID=215803 RepID=UPI0011BAC22C|nr:Rdx family protein [Enhygromyxa salina]
MPQATGLVAELEGKFPGEFDIELVEGDRGAFEVELDGVLIYSKLATRQFPRYAELPALITDLL